MRRALPAVIAALILLSICTAPASRAEDDPPEHGVGVTFLASSVGNDESVEDLLAFVEEARVRDVVIDWAWITLHWDRTKFDKVEELVGKLEKRGVRVAAMYRPRFKPHQIDDYKDIAFQVDKDGKPLGGACQVLYADAGSRKWGTKWAVEILEKCPSFDEVVIYNPSQSDQSDAVKAAREEDPDYDYKCVNSFLEETRKAMREVSKDAKLGLVLPPSKALYEHYYKAIDVARPYVFVREGAEYEEDIANALEVMKGAKEAGPALAKITWGAEDKVSDEWLGKFIAHARKNELPFVFWTFWTAFCDGKYDLDELCEALDLDAAKIKPLIRNLGGDSGLNWPPVEVQKAIDEAMDATGAEGYPSVLKAAEKYGEDAIGPLSKILDDDKGLVFDRWRAAGALGRIGSGKALEVLLRNSKDESDMVRWLCAEALGRCGKGSKKARERLEEMAENDPATRQDPGTGKDIYFVRETAKIALARLSQREPGEYEPFFEEMPWAETIEDALERGEKEGRLTVVFINPFDSPTFDSGYREAADFAAKRRALTKSPPERDDGFLKERAMLVGLLAEPRAAAFIHKRCVPVRMRLSYLHWTDIYRDEPDALKSIGMKAKDVGAPAVLMVSPEGKVVAHARNMSFYAPEMFHALAAQALENCDLEPPGSLKDALDALGEDPSAGNYVNALEESLDAGKFDQLETLTEKLPAGVGGVPRLALAEARLLQGRPDDAADILKSLKVEEGDEGRLNALRAEAYVRLGRYEDASKLADNFLRTTVAFDTWLRRLCFFDALGERELGEHEDRRITSVPQNEHGTDPWAIRASMYGTAGEPNPDEWCPFTQLELPEEFKSTESGLNEAKDKTESLDAIERAVLYLLERQCDDGRWEGPASGMPNESGASMQDHAQVARTALCVCALRDALPLVDKRLKARIEDAVEAGSQTVYDWNENPQPSIFALTYALHMELELFGELNSKARKASRDRVRKLVAKLRELEHDGGWSYTAPPRLHTFNTAPIMLSLARIKELELDEVDDLLERGAKFLESQRVGELAVFHYGAAMQHLTSEDDTKSSSMRDSLCELALLKGGFSEDTDNLAATVEHFFKHLEGVRDTAKRWEHFFSPDIMQDAYHYYFGTWYAAQAMVELKDKEGAKKLTASLLETQELDGSFADAQMVTGRNTATAMALLTLLSCREID